MFELSEIDLVLENGRIDFSWISKGAYGRTFDIHKYYTASTAPNFIHWFC